MSTVSTAGRREDSDEIYSYLQWAVLGNEDAIIN
jgi:hypothetical protein